MLRICGAFCLTYINVMDNYTRHYRDKFLFGIVGGSILLAIVGLIKLFCWLFNIPSPI